MAKRDAMIISRSTGWFDAATVDLLYADVLGSAEEMIREIQTQVPEYVAPAGEENARELRRVVDAALRRYVELSRRYVGAGAVADLQRITEPLRRGNGQVVDWRDHYRRIGANEMRAGRSVDALHSAARICTRVANRRLRAFASRYALPPDAVTWLAETIFDNIDAVAVAMAEGYARAQEAEAGESDRRRRRLVDLLLSDPPPSRQALGAAAAAARWHVPHRLAVVAVVAPEPLVQLPMLTPEILCAWDHAQPCVIVPDPEGRAQVRALVNGLDRFQAAVGLPVVPVYAAKSLRWAGLALELARKGHIQRDRIIWCGDHVGTLTVFQDEALVAALIERRLAPLAELREDKRQLFAETLLAWLTLDMNATEVAAHLHMHPQTVRRRLRRLTDLFRDQIRHPERRFELQIALRAYQTGQAR